MREKRRGMRRIRDGIRREKIGNTRGWRERKVEQIKPYKDGTDMNMYLEGLDRDLTTIGVDRREWKRILTSKLSIKATGVITDLMSVEDFGYEEVRERLLERTGVNFIQAGVQIFRGWMNNLLRQTRGNRSDNFFNCVNGTLRSV